MKLLFLLLTYSFYANSFTLNTNTAASFNDHNVKIYITSNSDCANTGHSASDILDIAYDGIKRLWNRVPTSNLRIKYGGILTTSDPLFLSGELCVNDSTTTCAPSSTVPSVDNIVIACNDNVTNFPASNIYALTAPLNISGSKISGSVILLNNTATSQLSQLSYNELRSALTHEIGHAFGLGHSKHKEALMYYKNATSLNRLSQDDIDGVTYLYPNKLDGCAGFMSSIEEDSNEKRKYPFFISLIIGLLLFFISNRMRKSIFLFSKRNGLFSRPLNTKAY